MAPDPWKKNLIVFGGKEYLVSVMTVARIRVLLDMVIRGSENDQEIRQDLVGESLFEEISLRELSVMTGIPSDRFEQATPAALRPVVEKIAELNPEYIVLRRRLAELGEPDIAQIGPWE